MIGRFVRLFLISLLFLLTQNNLTFAQNEGPNIQKPPLLDQNRQQPTQPDGQGPQQRFNQPDNRPIGPPKELKDKEGFLNTVRESYLPQILGGLLVVVIAGAFAWFKTRKKDQLFDHYLKKITDVKNKIIQAENNDVARKILLNDLDELQEQVKFDLAKKKIDLEHHGLILEKIQALLDHFQKSGRAR